MTAVLVKLKPDFGKERQAAEEEAATDAGCKRQAEVDAADDASQNSKKIKLDSEEQTAETPSV
jgi:hypothetical protein